MFFFLWRVAKHGALVAVRLDAWRVRSPLDADSSTHEDWHDVMGTWRGSMYCESVLGGLGDSLDRKGFKESRQVGDRRMQEASGKAFWQKADARGAPVLEASPYPVRDGRYVVSGSEEQCIHAAMQLRSAAAKSPHAGSHESVGSSQSQPWESWLSADVHASQ